MNERQGTHPQGGERASQSYQSNSSAEGHKPKVKSTVAETAPKPGNKFDQQCANLACSTIVSNVAINSTMLFQTSPWCSKVYGRINSHDRRLKRKPSGDIVNYSKQKITKMRRKKLEKLNEQLWRTWKGSVGSLGPVSALSLQTRLYPIQHVYNSRPTAMYLTLSQPVKCRSKPFI